MNKTPAKAATPRPSLLQRRRPPQARERARLSAKGARPRPCPPRPPFRPRRLPRTVSPTALRRPRRPADRWREASDRAQARRKVDPKLANAWKHKAGRDLTVDELLAMPESEYMNEKQLEFFRARLQKQKDDLLSNAGETTEHLREDTSIVPDPADRATIEEEHALELRTRDRERKLLKKIAQSLARLDSGEYGYLRRDRRAHRPGAPARPAHRHAVARSPAAPRTEAEDVRRLSAGVRPRRLGRRPRVLQPRPQGSLHVPGVLFPMAENESFFRKVVRFVANPATDWTELNSRQDDARELELEKSELKAMIERKRRNDFVRKREFDMLRSVRREGLSPEQLAALGGSSRLDDSEPRLPDGNASRHDGVKAKIDEIEQQMVGDSPPSAPPAASPRGFQQTALRSGGAAAPRRRLRARADDVLDDGEIAAAAAAAARLPAAARGHAGAGADDRRPAAAGAAAVAVLRRRGAHDGGHRHRLRQPVLGGGQRGRARSRARRGRDRLRQRRLRPMRRGTAAHHRPRRRTRPARRDLARAVRPVPRHRPAAALRKPGARLRAAVRLVGAAVVFAAQAGGRRAGRRAAGDRRASTTIAATSAGSAPRTLDIEAVARLRSQTLQMPLPWVFDWTRCSASTPRRRCSCRCCSACGPARRWRCAGSAGDRLFHVLQEAAPTGVRDADPAFWLTRLDALRLANRADQFDEAAIDYCVTYEVSPPSWERGALQGAHQRFRPVQPRRRRCR